MIEPMEDDYIMDSNYNCRVQTVSDLIYIIWMVFARVRELQVGSVNKVKQLIRSNKNKWLSERDNSVRRYTVQVIGYRQSL